MSETKAVTDDDIDKAWRASTDAFKAYTDLVTRLVEQRDKISEALDEAQEQVRSLEEEIRSDRIDTYRRLRDVLDYFDGPLVLGKPATDPRKTQRIVEELVRDFS